VSIAPGSSLPGFGTDGVRGLANRDLTPEYALALGRAAGRWLVGERRRAGSGPAAGGPATVVVGRDTRASGSLLEAALCAGLASEGVVVVALGVGPTPAVAWVGARQGWAGAMISASHNPFADNGIKLFAPGGVKLADEQQAAVEAEVHVVVQGGADALRPVGGGVGSLRRAADPLAGYRDAVGESIDGRRLDGLRVVIDSANGAASDVAPRVLRELGADLLVLADQPDGTNINEGCGSTHLGGLQDAVVKARADCGLAFDGDADRVLAVDHSGRAIDGDQLIGMCAIDLQARGRLVDDTVVVTVMANLGFRLGMRRRGISVRETAVGDRYVLEALESGGWSLGGEQSGHVIFRRLATTGDGLLTGVQVLDLLARSGRTLADLADDAMTRLPQVLRNVRLDRARPGLLDALAPAVSAVEARLGEEGRVLIRPSGTEPLIRVMVEATDETTAQEATDDLVRAVEALLNGG
jgi:phosphoglucosamine mutase